MNFEITVPESFDFFEQIQNRKKFLEIIRYNVREEVGKYLSKMMDLELTHFRSRERYERKGKDPNHPNGSYPRDFTLKAIGEVNVKVPRD